MTAIQTLIDRTFSYAETAPQNLRELYISDYRDFYNVNLALKGNNLMKTNHIIDEMDTEPREQIILAIREDYGDKMIHDLGYVMFN